MDDRNLEGDLALDFEGALELDFVSRKRTLDVIDADGLMVIGERFA